jgi:methyl-accepting chemotaxis protein
MRNSVALRLAFGFLAVVVLSLGLALYQLRSFHQAMAFLDAITQYDNQVADKLTDIIQLRAQLRSLREFSLANAALASARMLQQQGTIPADRYVAEARVLVRQIEELRRLAVGVSGAGVSPERRKMWEELADLAQQMENDAIPLLERGGALFESLREGRLAEAVQIRSTMEDLQLRLDASFQRSRDVVARMTNSGRADIQVQFDDAIRTAIVAIVAVILTAAAAAWVIGRSISVSMEAFIGFVQQVGQGDLTRRMPDIGGGELARLGGHLNAMTWSLREVASQTRAVAEEVNASTAEIRASAQEQAAAVAEQLSAIEETNATLTEITHSGAQITSRAQGIERTAQGVVNSSATGLRAVEEGAEAMDAIREQVETVARTIISLSERTQAIGEIILTVNAIAERSHLVALNASIEAAAAGEHGRTFSVVAAEIKRLADQARDATGRVRANLGEIQQGISSTVLLTEEAGKRVEIGRRQAAATEQLIRTLAANLQESVQAFQQIVAATNQHHIGLEQVMQALQSIRQAASETASTTRELEGMAGNLNTLSEQMIDAVRNYRL